MRGNSSCSAVQETGKPKVKVVPLRKAKRTAILSALTQSDGNVCLAAERLEIGKSTLYRNLKEYGVPVRRHQARKRKPSTAEKHGK